VAKILVEGPARNETMRELFTRLGERAGGAVLVPFSQFHTGVGYKVKTHLGREGMIAHVTGASLYRAGKYKVNVDDVDLVVVPAIRDALQTREVVLIDEIGKIMLFSERFRQAVLEAFDSDKHVVASVQDKPHGFVDKVRKLPGVVAEQTLSEVMSHLKA
jgi:nucleoside-triphosphatase